MKILNKETLGPKKSQFLGGPEAQLWKGIAVYTSGQRPQDRASLRVREGTPAPRAEGPAYLGRAVPQAVHGHSSAIVCVRQVYHGFADGFDHLLGNKCHQALFFSFFLPF